MFQEKAKPAEPVAKSASRLGRFAKETQKKGDPVKNIQDFAKKEAERKRKEEEEKKKKKTEVQTAPSEGFLSRLYKRMTGGQ